MALMSSVTNEQTTFSILLLEILPRANSIPSIKPDTMVANGRIRMIAKPPTSPFRKEQKTKFEFVLKFSYCSPYPPYQCTLANVIRFSIILDTSPHNNIDHPKEYRRQYRYFKHSGNYGCCFCNNSIITIIE